MGMYVVATKREARGEGVSAEQRIRGLPGVEIKGASNADRVVIEATPQTASDLAERFADKVLIEPQTMFHALSDAVV